MAEDSSSTNGEPSGESTVECDESDRAPVLPWTGPGVTPSGELGELDQSEYVLHSTWAEVPVEKEQEFLALSAAVAASAQPIEGLVGIRATRSERCRSLRTMGIWKTEAAMYQMLSQPEHIEAVTRAADVSSTGKTTHWTGSAEEARALNWVNATAALASIPTSPAYE